MQLNVSDTNTGMSLVIFHLVLILLCVIQTASKIFKLKLIIWCRQIVQQGIWSLTQGTLKCAVLVHNPGRVSPQKLLMQISNTFLNIFLLVPWKGQSTLCPFYYVSSSLWNAVKDATIAKHFLECKRKLTDFQFVVLEIKTCPFNRTNVRRIFLQSENWSFILKLIHHTG